MSESLPAANRADFEGMLRAQEQSYWDKHPFHQRMVAGELEPVHLRAYVANRWYYQCSLPQKDAAIIANCPLPEIRRRWLPRIEYHDGGDGGCVRWLRFVDAVGLNRAEVIDELHLLPGVRFSVDSYVTFARTRPWLDGIASSLTEMFAPQAMAARAAALKKYYSWIDEDALAYFDSRIVRARQECTDALNIVLSYCTSKDSQDAALHALAFKTDVLWSMLDAIEHSVQARR
ncbi:MAG: pyrroloquinoline-quinone synthase PqqC [Pseudonocardiaceae bacterium]